MLEKITKILDEKGLRQNALEQLAGLSYGRISKWKDRQGEPTAKQALRISRVLGVPVEFLIDDAVDEPGRTQSLTEDDRLVLTVYRDLRLSRAEALRGLSMVAAERGVAGPESYAGPRVRHNEGSVLDGLSLRATQQPRPRKAEPDGDVVREDITDQVRRRKRGEPDRKKGAG